MPSSASTRLGLNLQATGEAVNTWGVVLNGQALQLADDAIAGRTSFTLSGTKTLTSTNYVANEARSAILDVTSGTGGTVTLPSVSKTYVVRNACSGTVTFTTGGSTNAVVRAGDLIVIFTDGTNVYLVEESSANRNDARSAKITNLGTPTLNTDASTKLYVDQQAFAALSGNLPGQPGNQNRFLETDGSVATWGDPLPDQSAANGLVLSSDGTARTGATWINRLPLMTGKAGMSLQCSGTALTGDFWAFVGGLKAKTADYTIAATDAQAVISMTGSHTITFPAASAVTSGFSVVTANAGTGEVSFARTGSDTLDALTAYKSYQGEVRLWLTDGVSAWTSIVLKPFNMSVTGTLTITWPPGYSAFGGRGWGGGASGSCVTGSPGGGGGGGASVPYEIPVAKVVVGGTTAITIGAGGASVSGSSSAGNAGGTSSIGAVISFYGGAPGSATGSPGGGGGVFGAGSGVSGGAPQMPANIDNQLGGGSSSGPNSVDGGAAGGVGGGTNGSAGGQSLNGGGGGGGGGSTNAGAGGASTLGGSGGAGGGVASPPGVAGTAPGGGGGGSGGSGGAASGAGARGQVNIRGEV